MTVTSWDDLPLVLTREEAAEIIGMSPSTIDTIRRKDPTFPTLAGLVAGSRVRIPRKRFQEWVEKELS